MWILGLLACRGGDGKEGDGDTPQIIDLEGVLSDGECFTCDDLTVRFSLDNRGRRSITGAERVRVGVGLTGVEHDVTPCAGDPWEVPAETTGDEIELFLDDDGTGVKLSVPCNGNEATSRTEDLPEEFPGPGTLDLEVWVIVDEATVVLEASAEVG